MVVISKYFYFSYFLNIIQILVPTIIPTAEIISAGITISINSILVLEIDCLFYFYSEFLKFNKIQHAV